MKHIIDTEQIEKLPKYWSDGRMCYMIKVDELNALIAKAKGSNPCCRTELMPSPDDEE